MLENKILRNARVAIPLSLLVAASSLAAPSKLDPSSTQLLKSLKSDLTENRRNMFRDVLGKWEKAYGTRAVAPLVHLASDRALEDSDRYLALMGAARLGGSEIASSLTHLLQDRSWMIRAGALRALGALNHPKTASAVLPLLRDPALIVRTEAVEAIARMKPVGAADALLSALEAPENYHRGKAQWVPSKALSALVELKAKDVAPRLRPLLLRSTDPALQKKTIETLEALTGKKLRPDAPLLARVEEWKRALQARR